MAAESDHWATSKASNAKPATMNSETAAVRFSCLMRPSSPDCVCRAPQPGLRAVPIGKHPVAGQMWHPQVDFQIELLHIGEIGPAAPGREEAIVEMDIGIDRPREDDPRHHAIGTHETDARVGGTQTMRELQRKHHEGGP